MSSGPLASSCQGFRGGRESRGEIDTQFGSWRSGSRTVIEALNLGKRYDGGLAALDDLNLRVSSGEVYGLVGGAGAGKTTTFKLFMSAITPTRGQALVGGTNSAADPIAVKRRASFVSRYHSPFATVSARRNVDFFAGLGGPKRLPNRTEVENAMRRVGVPERCFDRRCDELNADVLV